MKTVKKLLATFILLMFWVTNISVFNQAFAQSPYDEVLGITTDEASLGSAVRGWGDVVEGTWATLFNKQVIHIISYFIDIFIVLWIAVAFFGWYKIMVSDKDENLKEWIRLVLFWIIWVIIMVSASFLANSLVWDTGIITTEFEDNPNPSWVQFADRLYNNIMYPFIKVVLYFVIWILFFIMAGKVVSFVLSTDDTAKKKAWWIIIRCVIWILIVMWSKQIVESVMWEQDVVLNKNATRVTGWDKAGMWDELLDFGKIPLVAQIINWVMWLTMFAILVLIIIQWYKIFTKPDDPKTRESMKKAIIYIIIWVLVIGAAYVISNVLVLNNIPIESATATPDNPPIASE